MHLSNLLTSIRAGQTTKEASAPPAPAPAAAAPTETKLSAALRDAVSASTETAKTASTQTVSPVAGVMKVATELAESEKLAALKEAALLGAAFADSYISRVSEWQKAAGELPAAPAMGQKVAAVNSGAVQTDDTFKKYAEENPVLARQAIALGYAPTAGGLEKMAEDSFVQGYNDQVSEIHKVAAEEFLKAAALTSLIIEKSAK